MVQIATAHQCDQRRESRLDHRYFVHTKAKLIIELDGSQHYSDFGLKYDQWRTKKLEIQNNCVLRYTNWDLVKYFDSVCDQIDYITIERLKELGHEDLVPKEI